MSDFGEAALMALVSDPVRECPFEVPNPPAVKVDPENITRDDRKTVWNIQENSGGKLGKNLNADPASHGDAGTWNSIPSEPPSFHSERKDTKHGGEKVRVKGDKAHYPFGVAAHHLIPGNASLEKSALYQDYMKKNGKITTAKGKKFTVKENIGYNVNGSHNGVWLPGNYAIRKKTSPKKGKSWGDIIEMDQFQDWCFDYMVAVIKKTKHSQFHDAHEEYSEAVLGLLNKIHEKLGLHQDVCKKCEKKDKIPPPYAMKSRLYALSSKLRQNVTAYPTDWALPFITSDRFKQQIAGPGRLRFQDAYDEA